MDGVKAAGSYDNDARKSLEQLLGGAVDADIARDAKKLLAQIKGR